MPDWLWIAILAAVIALPWISQLVARVKYSAEPSFMPRFERTRDVSHAMQILYLPGILTHGHASLLGLNDAEEGSMLALLRQYGDVHVMDYSPERFDEPIVKLAIVGKLRQLLSTGGRVTIIGVSLGGMLSHDVLGRINDPADRQRIRLVPLDSPSGWRGLGLGANFLAPFVRILWMFWPVGAGMLAGSRHAWWGPPKRDETQGDLDFDLLVQTQERRLSDHRVRVWLSQARTIARFRLKPGNLSGLGGGVHYVRCTLGNVNVGQTVWRRWKRVCRELVLHDAAMPHCGLTQQPAEAQRVMREVLEWPWNE